MQRDLAHLSDIVDAANLALSYVEGVEREAFMENAQLQDSVVRRIEIMGEAARRVSEETRAKYPDVPWREMIGMRNLLIHAYDAIDMEVVWDTTQHALPNVVALLKSRVDDSFD